MTALLVIWSLLKQVYRALTDTWPGIAVLWVLTVSMLVLCWYEADRTHFAAAGVLLALYFFFNFFAVTSTNIKNPRKRRPAPDSTNP